LSIPEPTLRARAKTAMRDLPSREEENERSEVRRILSKTSEAQSKIVRFFVITAKRGGIMLIDD